MASTGGTHSVSVPGVGDFVFRRRTMRDEFKIGAEYSRLVDGVSNVVNWLDQFAMAFATLKVLCEHAPEGWDMDGLDPNDPESFNRVLEVFGELRAAEARFRFGSRAAGKDGGAPDGGVDSSVVSPSVQPAAK